MLHWKCGGPPWPPGPRGGTTRRGLINPESLQRPACAARWNQAGLTLFGGAVARSTFAKTLRLRSTGYRNGSLGIQSSACAGSLHVLCDCQAVHSAIASPHRALLSLAAGEAADILARLRHRGLQIALHWVPSHDTHLHWTPPEGICDSRARALNAKADERANACRLRRQQGAARVQWYSDLQKATSWENKAIMLASQASDLLGTHVLSCRPATSADGAAAAAAED